MFMEKMIMYILFFLTGAFFGQVEGLERECGFHGVVVGGWDGAAGPAVVVVGEFCFPRGVCAVPPAESDGQKFAKHVLRAEDAIYTP